MVNQRRKRDAQIVFLHYWRLLGEMLGWEQEALSGETLALGCCFSWRGPDNQRWTPCLTNSKSAPAPEGVGV